jgi:cell wall-associated NlpC family hydrolase
VNQRLGALSLSGIVAAAVLCGCSPAGETVSAPKDDGKPKSGLSKFFADSGINSAHAKGENLQIARDLSKAELATAARQDVKEQKGPAPKEKGPAAQLAINWAQTKLGHKYVWGGDGSDNKYDGFDCSGLTKFAYRQAAVTLPRVANDQYATTNVHPSRGQLRPGDLVFYGRSARGIHHVGIYVGKDKNGHQTMLNAPNSDSVIRYDRIDTFGDDYYGATRVA